MGLESNTRVVELINSANTLELRPDQLTLGNPVDSIGDQSTLAVSSAVPEYKGSVAVQYRRLGLDHLFSCFVPRILVDETEGVLSTEDVVSRIRERYPIQLEVDELTVTHEVREDGDYYVVAASDNSLVYKSSVAVGTRPRHQTPITEFILPDTTSYVYPNNSANRAYARIYSGGWNLPECSIELSELLVGQAADMNLTWLTTIVSGEDWLLDPVVAGPLNLGGARVFYNGPVTGIDLHPDEGLMLYRFPDAMNVLIIELSDSLCTGLVGKLTYYYGAASV